MKDRKENLRRSISFLKSLGNVIDLSNFSVIGNYVRFDPNVRSSLQNFCDRVSSPLALPQPGLKTFLVWGPSGSGKSGLISELGNTLKEKIQAEFPRAIDLSKKSKEDYVRSLQSFSRLSPPKLGWIDEVDAKPEEKWPYDELFTLLPLENDTERIVFVLSGSGMDGDNLETFVDRIAKRQKGKDVLTRTFHEKTVVPPLGTEDRVLIASSKIAEILMEKHPSNNDEGYLIEKLALCYLASTPGFESGRTLTDHIIKAVHRKLNSAQFSLKPRFHYDDLFESGNNNRQIFLSEIDTKSQEYQELTEFVKVVPYRKISQGVNDKFPSLPPKKKTHSKEPKEKASIEPARTNLKASPFGKFIKRESPYATILKGLHERTTPVLVTGFMGTGKTSLAYEIAKNCISGVSGHPRFKVVVWISDKSRPGSTHLNDVLDEIARTVDYPGLIPMESSKKRREINGLLRSNSTLVIFDSFENVCDPAVVEWLCEIPEPSKGLVTSQPQRKISFPRDVKEISLKGMTEDETRHFVEYQIKRMGLEKLVKNSDVLAPLLRITEGNPKAIEVGLGLIKRQGRPLDQVVADLSNAKPPFDEFYSTGWKLLDEKARRLLLTMYFFPYGTKSGPLREVVGFNAKFDSSVDLLTDLMWLDNRREGINEEPTYSIHGMVSAFVSARLHENQKIECLIRHSWLAYLRRLASEVGFCWNDIGRLEVLDDENLRNTVRLGIDWSFEHGEYSDTTALARDVRYYFYVRGYWSDWSSEINLLRAKAAKIAGDEEEEFAALTYQINIASKQQNLNEIEKHLERLKQLADHNKRSPENMIDYQHAKALYLLAKGSFVDAEQIWIANLELMNSDKMPHAYNANMRWLAACLEKENRVEEASSLLRLALDHAQRFGFVRGIVDIGLKKASLYMDLGRLSEAAKSLEVVAPQLGKVLDRLYEAEYFYLLGRLEQEQQHSKEAKEYYSKALDGFKRLGMKEKISDVNTKLAFIVTVATQNKP